MKKIYPLIAVVVIIGALVWGLSAGRSGKPSGQTVQVEPIKIGAVLSLTGDAAPWGETAKNGISLAAKKINGEGGINGRQVSVIFEDARTSGKDAVSAFNKLVHTDRVSGVIGNVFDFDTQPMLPLAESNKIALITPSNFRIEGSFETNPYTFVMLINFDDMIRYYREFLGQKKIQKLAIVHFTSSWGTEISKTISEIMTDHGKPKPTEEVYTKIGGNDYRTTILKLKNAGVDTIFFDMLGEDTVNFLKNLKALDYHPTLLTYAGSMEAFNTEQDKSLIEGVAAVNWEMSSPAFNAMYQQEFGKPAGKSADKAFDALYVMAQAIAAATSTEVVASYIAGTSFKTQNATIVFTPEHTVQETPIEIQVVKNGVLVPWNK